MKLVLFLAKYQFSQFNAHLRRLFGGVQPAPILSQPKLLVVRTTRADQRVAWKVKVIMVRLEKVKVLFILLKLKISNTAMIDVDEDDERLGLRCCLQGRRNDELSPWVFGVFGVLTPQRR